MQLSPNHFDEVLNDFLKSWNPERIRSMSIAEYADLSDKDSLCYWLEYGTKPLGQIGGISLAKFELWKPKEEKKFKDNRFIYQDGYAWKASRGATIEDAFSKIKILIIQIITCSMQEKWSDIDEIEFHAIGKWKLAFLFSGKKLFPVYAKDSLLLIAKRLGYRFNDNEKISVLQQAILREKPEREDVVAFAYRTFTQFVEQRIKEPNYYIVGGKYGETSVINDFMENGCIAIGWLDWLDYSKFMGAGKAEISKFVQENYTEESPPVNIIARYFILFSQIREGDIIAIKSRGSYNKLTIIAYAKVKTRNGNIYFHDKDLLGHHIHVDFLDAGFSRMLERTYGGTIHEINPGKDQKTFYEIFGWYADHSELIYPENIFLPEEESVTLINDEGEEEGYNLKIETSFERSSNATVIVNRIHNRIQNRFIRYLCNTYPGDKCSGEKKYIDAKRTSENDIYIYEIKPYSNAYLCIRDGIGQLLDYRHNISSSKNKRIVIVGPNHPSQRDLKFIEELKTVLNIPFNYIAFDASAMEATEY